MSFVCFGVFFVIGSFVVFLCWTHIVLFQIVKSKLNNKKSTLQATWLKKKRLVPTDPRMNPFRPLDFLIRLASFPSRFEKVYHNLKSVIKKKYGQAVSFSRHFSASLLVVEINLIEGARVQDWAQQAVISRS